MAREARDTSDIRNAIRWNFVPHRYGATGDAKVSGYPAKKPSFSSQQGDASWLHAVMLSMAERSLSTRILQDGLAIAKAAYTYMDIANRIKAGRAATKISQRGLAEKMQVSPSAVAQWETGVTSPSIPNRVDLARILRIPFIELVPEAGTISEQALKDPLILAIVQQALRLPEQVREALLMQLSATAEALSSGAPTDDTIAE